MPTKPVFCSSSLICEEKLDGFRGILLDTSFLQAQLRAAHPIHQSHVKDLATRKMIDQSSVILLGGGIGGGDSVRDGRTDVWRGELGVEDRLIM